MRGWSLRTGFAAVITATATAAAAPSNGVRAGTVDDWTRFEAIAVSGGLRVARAGFTTEDRPLPAGIVPTAVPESAGGGLAMDGRTPAFVIASPGGAPVPSAGASFTASAWVAIDAGTRWGGIVGCVQDNGGHEKGWVLGYDQERFTFGLSTDGADDGDGRLTYIRGATPFVPGRWHHVAATWDGRTARIWVDGRMDAERSTGADFPQSGAVVLDDRAPLVVGGYVDADEHHRLQGRLDRVRLEPAALDAAEVQARVQARRHRLALAAWIDPTLRWTVEPYLTWPALDGVSVLAETRTPTRATLTVRPADGGPARTINSRGLATRHEFRIEDLEPNAKHYYRMTCRNDDSAADPLESRLASFRTAAREDDAFTFVAIGDTQAQPDVVRRVAAEAFAVRPSFTVIAGDLVTTGSDTSHWTGHFFPNMRPLIEHAPMVTVLGNHEQDAKQYYDYLALPGRESYYTFTYGNAEFFMIDGNRPLAPGTEQHDWLEDALAASTATWRFAVVHQPPYTSDSDDYGDTRRGVAARGDANVRHCIPLFEEWGVDICFSGHVHDYERTFPVLEGRTARWKDGGVIYVTTAGGGGHLEDFDPTSTWFGNHARRTHHLVHVAVNGNGLEYRAIDDDGRLFDVMFLEKPADGSR